jgi:PmbA protein
MSRGGEDLLALAVRVAEQAAPGEQVEAYVGRSSETQVRVYQGEVEHLTSSEVEGVGIRVVRDGRTGFAYSGVLDEEALRECLAEARDNVGFGTPDEWAGLAQPDGVAPPALDLWSDDVASLPTDAKIDLARELERLTLAVDDRILVQESNYDDVIAEEAVASSTGIRASGRETGCYVFVETMVEEDGVAQVGYAFSVGRAPDELDLATAATEGADRAIRMIGATKPASRRLTVVLDPLVTAQLLGVLSSTLNGESVLKGRSLFANRIGEQVANGLVTLVDDPTDRRAFGASHVDAEGLATRRNVLIEGGVLQRFVQSSYSGRRSGSASTGNAVRGSYKSSPGCGCLALSLVPGARSQADLVASVDAGVLVQSVQGLHSGVNPVSGDFSTGADGLLIEGGQLGAPVKEFTIASTLQRMLHDVIEVGGDVAWLPMTAAGVSVVIGDIMMSGV